MIATLLSSTTGPVSGDALALDSMLTVQRVRAADWAEARVWGRTTYVPGQGNRRTVAYGKTFTDSHGTDMVAVHDVSHRNEHSNSTSSYVIEH